MTISRGPYIGSTPLQVLNQPGHPSTFRNSRGFESNVDVTLASPGIAGACGDWRVIVGKTQSDHRIIGFDIVTNEAPPAELIRPVANWNTYVKNVEEMIRDLPELSREASVEEIETHVSQLTGLLKTAAAEASDPGETRGRRRVMWWSSSLDRARRRLDKLRARLGRALQRGARRANDIRVEYWEARSEYERELGVARRAGARGTSESSPP